MQLAVDRDLSHKAGSGAAEGVSFALATFVDAELVSGAELILDKINFDDFSKIVILYVGEGKMNQQSLYGKIPITVAQRAKQYNVKK